MPNIPRFTIILIVTATILLSNAFAQDKVSGFPKPGQLPSRTLDTLARQLKLTAGERWYKNCFIYNLDVRTFQDSDGDGIGDFRGLTSRLPYLKKLGVDVIWMAPFQPSPHKDDGYDVTDYYAIDSSCGTPGDFAEFLYHAHTMGIRVMMDMILAHTSDQHPWFEKAAADTASPYYHWYFWSKTRPPVADSGTAFPGVQKETWSLQDTAHQYYFHRFYDFQPHLNFTNPAVLAEAEKILAYWIDQGIDGFRLDAVPFLIEIPKTNDPNSDQSLTLITMLHNEKQLEMAYSLMFALPGSEELHYGEELGMGDDLSLQERLAVRTPMQWSNGTNAGFSTAKHPIRPLITRSDYTYKKINVHDEELDSNSLLEHLSRLIKLRKACPEIGLGDWLIPDSSRQQLLVMRYEYGKDALVIIHNFSPDPQPFNPSPAMHDKESFTDLLTGTALQPGKRQTITIPGYGHKWYRLNAQ